MTKPTLYRGVWPQNVSKLAKYALRFLDGMWKITVLYEVEEGLRYLAVEGGGADLIQRINAVKRALRDQPGGAFYVNEFRHVLVPVADPSGSGFGSLYYCAGRLDADLTFEFEGEPLTTKPVRPDGSPLAPGDRWVGPRPGIPYVLAAGGSDIYYESPALTDTDPPTLRPRMTRKVYLSKVLGDKSAASRCARIVADVRGHAGGRFYVNEHGAMFTPVGANDGIGLDYIYCGQIERGAWFPEPPID
jgi:hypothetical protein